MTTAGRPTWTPAIGGEGRSQSGNRVHAPIKQFSSRDLKSHTKLKFRQPGQNTLEEVRERDLALELEEKEKEHFKDFEKTKFEEEVEVEPKLLTQGAVEDFSKLDADDSDDSESEESSDESEDEEEETKELLKELEKIKKEREEEEQRREQERLEFEAREKEEQAMQSNPLLAPQDFTVKKRWYDDTVFKNQARGEMKQQKRFINDTIRNDFHRKFLNKYIQ